MKCRLFALISLLALTLSSPAHPADNVEELTKRIKDLELRLEDLEVKDSDSSNPVSSFFHNQLTLGGFFEPAVVAITGPNTDFQVNNVNTLLGLNISAEFNSHYRFVTQILSGLSYTLQNPHSDPSASAFSLPASREFGAPAFGTLVTQGYIEYQNGENFRVQGGIGYVPFGIAFQQREPVLFLRRSGPEILRTSYLVSPLWSGLHVLGAFRKERMRWGYNAYTAASSWNSKIPSAGTRLWSTFNEKFTTGISSQIGKQSDSTYTTLGADLQYKMHPFSIIFEYAEALQSGPDPLSAYLEPSVEIFNEEIILYGSLDYSDSPLNRTGAGSAARIDPFRKFQYGAGVNWLPTPFTRLRLGLVWNDYVGKTANPLGQNRDYLAVDLSGGIAF